uniref:NADH dehydrogenase subunit 6 n=1 Tax=Synanthedon bicingulata TaxID=3138307 RepID=UPI00315CD7D7
MMFFLNHPLSMGMFILMQTITMCLITGMLIKTYWFSYILFLTFLGGLLVLFIYVSSIASNEMFKPSLIMKTYFLIIFLISIILSTTLLNKLNWMNFSLNEEMNNFSLLNLFTNNENKINLFKLYNSQTFFIMLILIIYLLITLLAIVKITNIFYGPLRSSE